MQAGPMRHKITFQLLQGDQNSYGEPINTWVDFATVRASLEPLLGNEFFRAEAVQSKVEVKFRTRYIPGVNNAMRIQHGSDAYEIISAIDVQSRHRELLIYAKKVV
jgi:SPP1 family predicted phage head-tail adaptor